jgi:hypothetical protein
MGDGDGGTTRLSTSTSGGALDVDRLVRMHAKFMRWCALVRRGGEWRSFVCVSSQVR